MINLISPSEKYRRKREKEDEKRRKAGGPRRRPSRPPPHTGAQRRAEWPLRTSPSRNSSRARGVAPHRQLLRLRPPLAPYVQRDPLYGGVASPKGIQGAERPSPEGRRDCRRGRSAHQRPIAYRGARCASLLYTPLASFLAFQAHGLALNLVIRPGANCLPVKPVTAMAPHRVR